MLRGDHVSLGDQGEDTEYSLAFKHLVTWVVSCLIFCGPTFQGTLVKEKCGKDAFFSE